MEYITFPWEQLGKLLRGLSLSGGSGNVAAWILFLMVGAIPLTAAVVLFVRHRTCGADLLLPVLSVMIYGGLWFFVNPSYMDRYLAPLPMGNFAGKALASVLDGLLLTWVLLRCLNGFGKLKQRKLFRRLQLLLGCYVLLLTAAVLWQGTSEISASLGQLRENSSGMEDLLMVSSFFLVLQAIAVYLPQVLELALFGLVIGFLHSCEEDVFSERSCVWVKRLKEWSGYFLAAIILVPTAVNLLQLLLARYLLNVHYTVVFPLWELVVVLGILVLSRFYLESRRLKQDNDMFI